MALFTDPEDPSANQERNNNVADFLAHVYHHVFVREAEIPAENRAGVLPAYFCGWLDSKRDTCDWSAMCTSLHLPVETWLFVREMLDGGLMPERIAPIWYRVIFADRPPPKKDVVGVTMTCLIDFADGVKMPVQAIILKDMVQSGAFTDAVFASALQRMANQLAHTTALSGIDALHAMGSDYRGTTESDPFEVFMGLFLQELIPKLQPQYREITQNYFRLFQTLVRPLRSPEQKAALAKMRAHWDEEAAKAKAVADGKSPGSVVSGGWET